DAASALLDELDGRLAALDALLRDPTKAGFVLVTSREPVVLAETLRYQEELARRRIPVTLVVVNRAAPPDPAPAETERMAVVPPLEREPVGVDGLRRFAAALSLEGPRADASPGAAARPDDAERVVAGDPFLPPLDRPLYLVAGKGGVGKTTAAAALALRLRGEGRRVLLL